MPTTCNVTAFGLRIIHRIVQLPPRRIHAFESRCPYAQICPSTTTTSPVHKSYHSPERNQRLFQRSIPVSTYTLRPRHIAIRIPTHPGNRNSLQLECRNATVTCIHKHELARLNEALVKTVEYLLLTPNMAMDRSRVALSGDVSSR